MGAGSYRVAVVCLGNICRSPIAAIVLRDRIEQAGLADRVQVDSAGTGDWHLGDRMDPRAATVLTERGYDASLHRARHFDADWFAEHDLILAMDAANLRDITALAPTAQDAAKIRMFRDADPLAGPGDTDVPDPFYGADDGFDDVLAMVERTSTALVAELATAVRAGTDSRAG